MPQVWSSCYRPCFAPLAPCDAMWPVHTAVSPPEPSPRRQGVAELSPCDVISQSPSTRHQAQHWHWNILTRSCQAPAPVKKSYILALVRIPPTTLTELIQHAIAIFQLPVVRSEHVRSFFFLQSDLNLNLTRTCHWWKTILFIFIFII